MPLRKGMGPVPFMKGEWNGPGKPAFVDRRKRYSDNLTEPPLVSRLPPTFVSYTASTFVGTTTPKTVAPVVAIGDQIAIFVAIENEFGTVALSGGGLTYNNLASSHLAGWCGMDIHKTTATANGTLTITGTATGVLNSWGMCCYVYRNSDGIGQALIVNEETGLPPFISFVAERNRSAMPCMILDWDAVAVTGRVWRTVNGITPTAGNALEKTASQEVGHMTTYSAVWNDVPPGYNIYGMESPNQKPLNGVVEVLGVGSDAFEGWGVPI